MENQEYPDLPFVPPRAYGTGRAGYAVQYVVVHYTAGSERATSAEDGALYDQRRTDGTSCHYFHDQNSTVQCVYTWDRANSAFFYGNRLGIHHELCGTQQTREQWLDPASDGTLWQAAKQIARDCQKYGLPVRWLTPQQMRNGERGICGHAEVTLAYGLGDHMDPGTEFPRDVLLARVQQFLAPTPTPQTEEEDDMGVLYHAIDDNGTQILVDDRAVFAWVSGGQCRVAVGPSQTLANKVAAPPAAPDKGTGNSSGLSKAEWNELMVWMGVPGNRFDEAGIFHP